MARMSKQTKGIIQIAVVLFSIIAVITYFLITLFNNNETETVNNTAEVMEVSSEDLTMIETLSSDFIENAGSFGVKNESVNSETIGFLREDVRITPSRFFTTRIESYNKIKTLLSPDGNVFYDYSVTDNWKSFNEEEVHLMGYEIINYNVNVDSEGINETVNNETRFYVKSTITFDSSVHMFSPTMDDSGWDGTYFKNYGEVTENTVTLTLLKRDEMWSIFDIEMEDNNFLLSTWSNPNVEQFYNDFDIIYDEQVIIKDDFYVPFENEEPLNLNSENNVVDNE